MATSPQTEFDPNIPIPNNPFYSPNTDSAYTETGPLVIGTGLVVTADGELTATGSGVYPNIIAGVGISVTESSGNVTITNAGVVGIDAGAGIALTLVNGRWRIDNTAPAPANFGTVTQVTAGAGLTGGPITTTGSLGLEPVGTIAPGTYNYATITVDQYGRVTFASPGVAPQKVQGTGAISVTQTSPQVVSVASASSTTPGVVALDNTTTNTATDKAATANAVKVTFDLANSANTLASQACNLAVSATSTANAANAAAASASTNASQALSTANAAAATANTALSTANSAQTDATQALSDAAAAQSTADSATTALNQKVPCSAFTGKGQFLAGTGTGTFTVLNAGLNGQILVADSTTASGFNWRPAGAGTVTSVGTGIGLTGGPITDSGTIQLANTSVIPGTYNNTTLTVDATGRITNAFSGVSPITIACFTQKGQLLTAFSECNPQTLALGTQGQYLRVNQTCPSGLEWVTSDRIPCSALVNKGEILVGDGAGPTALPAPPSNAVLQYCAACPLGVFWGAKCGGTVTCITTSGGITGGPITVDGNISLENTTVNPGTYTYSTFTVDSKGRIQSALSGTPPNTTVSAPITNTGTAEAPVIGVSAATTSARGVVQVGSNINISTGVISVNTASLLQKGVVQLHNSVTSTDTTQALTAAQGKVLNDRIDEVRARTGIVLAGTYDPTARVMVTVTDLGTAAGFVKDQELPIPDPSIDDYFVIVTSDENYAPPAQIEFYDLTQGDWLYTDGNTWIGIDAGKDIPPSSTTDVGITRFATVAETALGTSDQIAITPAGAGATYIPSALLAQKGSLVTADGSNLVALPLGNDKEVLIACSACPTGLAWSTDLVTYNCFVNKGYIVAGLGPDIPVSVAPGAEGTVLTVCSTATSGLAWKPLPASDSIQCSELTAKGDMIVGASASTPAALPVGTAGQFLTANPSALYGVEWATYQNQAIPCSCLENKGDIVTSGGLGTVSVFPVGSDGYVLKACSACPLGLTWGIDQNTGGIPCSLFTDKGQLIGASGANAPIALPAGTQGQYLVADPNTPTGLDWVTLVNEDISCSSITAKGTLITGTAAGSVYSLPAGNSGQILKVCPTAPSGLAWVDETPIPPTPDAILRCEISGCGSLIVGSGPSTPAALPIGTEGQVLKVCTVCPLGITWSTDALGADIPCSCITAKGSLITGTANSVPAPLAVGLDGYVLKACSADPKGLAWAPEDPGVDIPCAVLAGKGDIITASTPGTPVALPVGPEGYVLRACATAPTGLAWAPDNVGEDVPCSAFTSKGVLLAGTGANTFSALPPGTDGYVLKTCSTSSTGLCWEQEQTGQDIPCSIISGSGDLIIGQSQGVPTALNPGANGQVLKACSDCAGGLYWATDASGQDIPCSILTQRGSIITATATSQPIALAPGVDGYVLKTKSADPSGLVWCPDLAASAIPCDIIIDKGSLIVGSSVDTPAALGVGTNGYVLTADSAAATGVSWCPSDAGGEATPTTRGVVFAETSSSLSQPIVSLGWCANPLRNPYYQIAIGTCALSCLQVSSTYANNIALGHYALCGAQVARGTIAIGNGAGSQLSGDSCLNVFIGDEVVRQAGLTTGSVAIGACASICTPSFESVSIGYHSSRCSTSSSQSVVVGACAANPSAGSLTGYLCQSVAIGWGAHCLGQSSASNNVALGFLSGSDNLHFLEGRANTIVLGNDCSVRFYVKVPPAMPSESSHMKVLGNVPLALPFIESLNPVVYQHCDETTGAVTDSTCRYGFVAEDILACETLLGAPVIVHEAQDAEDRHKLEPTALIPPIVNAIKELSAQLASLCTEVQNIQTILANNNIS